MNAANTATITECQGETRNESEEVTGTYHFFSVRFPGVGSREGNGYYTRVKHFTTHEEARDFAEQQMSDGETICDTVSGETYVNGTRRHREPAADRSCGKCTQCLAYPGEGTCPFPQREDGGAWRHEDKAAAQPASDRHPIGWVGKPITLGEDLERGIAAMAATQPPAPAFNPSQPWKGQACMIDGSPNCAICGELRAGGRLNATGLGAACEECKVRQSHHARPYHAGYRGHFWVGPALPADGDTAKDQVHENGIIPAECAICRSGDGDYEHVHRAGFATARCTYQEDKASTRCTLMSDEEHINKGFLHSYSNEMPWAGTWRTIAQLLQAVRDSATAAQPFNPDTFQVTSVQTTMGALLATALEASKGTDKRAASDAWRAVAEEAMAIAEDYALVALLSDG